MESFGQSARKLYAPFLVCLLTCSVSTAQAGTIYRCETNGVVEYSNSLPGGDAGKACREIELPAITTIPAPPPQPKTANAKPTTGKSAGSVVDKDTQAANKEKARQKAREEERSRILRDELAREQTRLKTLQSEYNSGEPERRGDERNYQKYLTRVDGLKEGIERREANIRALQRELKALK